MKKTYISPEALTVELRTRHHLMNVSYTSTGDGIRSMNFDTDTSGSDQLTKENRSVWDNEW